MGVTFCVKCYKYWRNRQKWVKHPCCGDIGDFFVSKKIVNFLLKMDKSESQTLQFLLCMELIYRVIEEYELFMNIVHYFVLRN